MYWSQNISYLKKVKIIIMNKKRRWKTKNWIGWWERDKTQKWNKKS